MGGSAKPVVSAVGGAGKSAPQTQNNYGSAYQAPSAQIYQPTYGGMLGGGGAPSSGGKSSGAGQGGYGGAPGFGGQQFTAQNNPTSTPFSPYGPADPSTYTTSYPNRPSPPSGGKSLGGVSPYGDAPGFGGQPFDPRFSPAQMENRSRFQGSRLEGDNIVDASGRRIGAIGQPFVGPAAPTPTPQQDFVNPRGSMAPDLSEQGYRKFLTTARFSGTPPTYEQWKSGREQQMQPQFNPYQQPMQQDFVNPRGTMSPEMQAYYAQDRANQAEMFNRRFQQPMQQFNPYQQSPFNPYQQPMQQPGFSGLQELFNLMKGQNISEFNRPMPQYQSPSSMYRPNMQQVQQNLSRVRPSVQRQRQDEQAARIAELEAQLARFNSGE